MKVEILSETQGWIYLQNATVRVCPARENCYDVTVVDPTATTVNAWDGRRLRVNGVESVGVWGTRLHRPYLTLIVQVVAIS